MFSIITTSYNSEATIKETLESVLTQSFQEFEWIIIDDGSTDASCSIIESYDDQRIKLLRKKRMGRANALNFGISKVNFPYVCIIDADDLWHTKKLEFAKKELELHPSTDILCTDLKTFTENTPKDDYYISLSKSRLISFNQLVRYNHVCHSSAIIKTKLANYSPLRKTQIDYELWLRLAEKGAIIRKQNMKLTYHRLHANQNFEGKANFKYRMNAIRLTQKYARKRGLWLSYLWLPIFYTLGFLKQIMKYNKLKE